MVTMRETCEMRSRKGTPSLLLILAKVFSRQQCLLLFRKAREKSTYFSCSRDTENREMAHPFATSSWVSYEVSFSTGFVRTVLLLLLPWQ
jgi:hypothetical protein